MLPQSHCTTFIWREVKSQLLVIDSIDESEIATSCLSQLFAVVCLKKLSIESFLCVLRQFLKQIHPPISPPKFLSALVNKIKNESKVKPYLIQLQTQSLLHGLHMHITLTEDDCPVCKHQPLGSYIQQVSLSFKLCERDVENLLINFLSPNFEEYVITSFAVNIASSKVDVIFYLPKWCFSQDWIVNVTVDSYMPEKRNVVSFMGTMKSLNISEIDYIFLPPPSTPEVGEQAIHLGNIVKHISDGHIFETIISMSDTCLTTMKESKLTVEFIESNQLVLQCGERLSKIVYPYVICSSGIHIIKNLKKRTISVKAERDRSSFYEEKPTYHVDLSDKLNLPIFHCSDAVMQIFCEMQRLHNPNGDPVFNVKSSFTELFKNVVKGKKYFTLISTPLIKPYAFIYVRNLRYCPDFCSPALDVSFCLLDTKSEDITFELVATLHSDHVHIMVDDAEFMLLKKVFVHFSQCSYSTKEHPVTLPVEYEELRQHFNHAILFPLNPNPANKKFQKFLEFLKSINSVHDPAHPSPTEIVQMGKACENVCSYCKSSNFTSIVACNCDKAKYCCIECKELHWQFHSKVCEQNKDCTAKPQICLLGDSKHAIEPQKAMDKASSVNEAALQTDVGLCSRCKKPATITCICKLVSYCSKPCQNLDEPSHSEKCKQQQAQYRPNAAVETKEYQAATILNKAAEQEKATTSDADCSNCGGRGNSLKRCSKCKNVWYCNNKCQRIHWPQHQPTCTRPKT